MSRPTVRRYPLEPIRALTGWSMQRITDVAPCNAEERRRRLTEGVTEHIADRLAAAAGYHPHVVWPEMLDHAIEDQLRECAADDCTNRFMPRRGQRYCSHRCSARVSARRRYQESPEVRERRKANAARWRAEAGRALAFQPSRQSEARREQGRRYYERHAERIKAEHRARYQAKRAAETSTPPPSMREPMDEAA